MGLTSLRKCILCKFVMIFVQSCFRTISLGMGVAIRHTGMRFPSFVNVPQLFFSFSFLVGAWHKQLHLDSDNFLNRVFWSESMHRSFWAASDALQEVQPFPLVLLIITQLQPILNYSGTHSWIIHYVSGISTFCFGFFGEVCYFLEVSSGTEKKNKTQ